MIVTDTERGRCELDRKTGFFTWSNEATHDFYGDVAKLWGCSRSDVIEGVARASRDNPDFLEQLKRSTLLVQNENRKHPQEIPAAASELTPEEAYQHLHPDLKKGEKKQDILDHFETLVPITVEVLELEEDRVFRRLYEDKKEKASEAETLYKGSALGAGGRIKISRNEVAYADRVKELRAEYEAEKAARLKDREKRRALLGKAALLLAPQLKQPGNPQHHRQYAAPSPWDTDGPLTRADLKPSKDSS